jgi:GntR family transcriptional regulator
MSEPVASRKHARRSLTDAVVTTITEAISRGEYPPGSPLPSETELSGQMNVSRATLREALRTLEDRQVVIRRHGRGTFVSAVPIVKDLHRNFGITAMIRAAGYHPATADQSFEKVRPSREAAQKLALDADSQVSVLRRVRLADKRPVVLSNEILPVHLLSAEDVDLLTDRHQSLYAFLYREKGIAIYRGRADLVPMKATAELAAALDVKRGDILLCISQVDFDDAGRPVMYSVEHHVPDWVRFSIERIGPGSAVDD